ncbi:Arabinose metabolism transcriptional repressor [Limihaloglobus sulfuriphilus]|uniref:Arabinose metabolism transcriptional repressor n=1 Tax=Limihaloglobus sulfuriphilus TaxID=1851148 RepID=A0A1Q2MCX6_9BACT|nr:GntR family transcriptional regulator [Limihaloglobus sulfuriphilus]AQQ70556.1 Arabinose metabolism transcriptional repressor [Limihaloglobus sulfuriphilus]
MALQIRNSTPLIDSVGKKIRDEILSSGYSVGDKLPSVTELAAQFSVSDKTIQRVLSIMKEDGMLSSHVGKGTFLERLPYETEDEQIGGGTGTIAVLDGQSEVDLTQHTESWTTRIVHGMRIEAAEHGVDLLLVNESLELSSLSSKLMQIKDRVDGVITFPFTDNYTMCNLFRECGIPFTTINRPCANTMDNYVSANYLEGSKMVGMLFAEIKCRKVLFVTTQIAGIFSKELRYKGLLEGLRLSGSDSEVEILILDSAGDLNGYEAVNDVIKSGNVPDGIYCSGDYLAIGAMAALKKHQIPIGVEGGTSVVGSSGFELAAHVEPSLSVVQIPMVEMGKRAIKQMLEIKNSRSKTVPGEIIPTKLILRKSTPASLIETGWLERNIEYKTQINF